ncbi:oxidoreductase [Halolactibacillus alkaliphilus]|uniref:Oxidoreductase n=1 Tax=Halolactibacillus alkaliphilus TaxID=442899 RepID=A0A511X453_9BACI|nr:Gfo/Idh/MocA family oxidoreductase [Halolactibacillus alkaliphilus]GEN57713.1 oxidoreductase [Halolactibacillus alkaliphilus]GGN74795.1 oxidoreductase [Halolactibacillus alkaliphilus]SFP03436.1 Predicted dehydrogenase [Halolactibacillus alkaliphilus]
MKILKVGIIGCGNIFPMHAASVIEREDTELVAVCDVKRERADEKASQVKAKAYYDYEEMLDKESLDVVHICLPHHLHAPVTAAATKRKIHVMTEKPMAIHYDDAVAMIDGAKENGVMLGVIFQNRYNPGSQLIKKMLTSGELGQIKSGKLQVTWDRSDAYYQNSDWKGTWEKEGGGVIIDQAIHTMDLMRWFVDSELKYVDASISNRAHEIIEVEDAAEGVIAYKNGVVTAFHAINYYTYDAPVEIELHCEKGIAKMVADKATVTLEDGRTFVADHNPLETFTYDSGVKGYWGVSHVKQINKYYDVIQGKKEVLDIPAEEALKTQQMINAVYQSGKEKQRVNF